jgi:hypothetical protein
MAEPFLPEDSLEFLAFIEQAVAMAREESLI